MKKSQIVLVFIALLAGINTSAQLKDTVRIMHYNLLYYGQATTNCTVNNNNVNNKDGYLKTIINHVKPDIFTVNELGCNSVYARRIRDLVLNENGSEYEMTELKKSGSQNICNMLYYKKDKVKFVSHEIITKAGSGNNIIRAVDLYELKFIASNLAENQLQLDTPSTYFLTMHLKASNGTADRSQRDDATTGIMQSLDGNKRPGNYVLSGDLNVYTSTEGGFANLTNWTNSSYNFKDPANRVGNWSNNSDYKDVHTQSTHSNGGCHSGGGMDDRFDFILASQDIINGNYGIKYIPGTYKALGQDGNRFNGSLTSPTNNSEPSAVINALYNMSDHLPVIMDVEISFRDSTIDTANTIQQSQLIEPKIDVWVNQGELQFYSSVEQNETVKIDIYDLTGKLILTDHSDDINSKKINTHNFNAGIYIVHIEHMHNRTVSKHKILLN